MKQKPCSTLRNKSMLNRRRTHRLEKAVFAISKSANQAGDLNQLYREIHAVLGTLMPAQNFFICLYHPETDEISFPYFVDQFDETPPRMRLGNTLTGYVIRTGRPLLVDEEGFRRLVEKGEVDSRGADSIDWLGTPLIVEGRPIGALVVQSYTAGLRYTRREEEILTFMSSQVAMAIQTRQGEARYRAIVEDDTDIIVRYLPDGRLSFANRALCAFLNLPREELLGLSLTDLFPAGSGFSLGEKTDGLTPENPTRSLEVQWEMEGQTRWLAWIERALFDDNGLLVEFQGVGRDITEQKLRQYETESILELNTALRRTHNYSQMTGVVVSHLAKLLNADQVALVRFQPAVGKLVVEAALPQCRASMENFILEAPALTHEIILKSRPVMICQNDLHPAIKGLLEDRQALYGLALVAQGFPVGAIWIGRAEAFSETEIQLLDAQVEIIANALHRVTLSEQTQARLRRLAALRNIDMAISESMDLSVTLDILTDQIISQLKFDAVSLMVYNPHTQLLEASSESGFSMARRRSKARLRMGESHAGKVALERKVEIITNLDELDDALTRGLREIGQTFKTFIGLPLVAKGQVKGVLELFQREKLSVDAEWLDFLQSLASKIAIVMDTAETFESLQKNSTDMHIATNGIIESWSQMVETRDGHPREQMDKMLDATLGLAQIIGMASSEMEHLRQGVLLHDIGLMSVPDSILLKPGPLIEEEWDVIRQHPVHAYQLLSPILRLRRALDIPYCHHEHWDGLGYPRGLKGMHIPLAARLFAVVDTWFALTSPRPFRSAWPVSAVRQYIAEQAGQQFDPVLARNFLDYEQNGFKAGGLMLSRAPEVGD
ncbi:MAG TPA: GAF domain-containing protein [Anaerolineaceae bacterium]|nr:GAF domain-containing protein [Anaerolineaceae bacterium]HPN54148.1 GAF domain-containing protein [Anaerolineaceae bacterium]